MKLYLASASPRRRALLRQMAVPFESLEVAIDETMLPGEDARVCVQRLACQKARAGAVLVEQAQGEPGWVLGADTGVIDGARLLGKPVHREAARYMLESLKDRTHEVCTAFACARTHASGAVVVGPECVVSRVQFGTWTAAEMEQWLDQNEWPDKAGGYAIQGYGAAFIAHLEGSYSAVMGLPLYELRQLLARLEKTP